MPIYFLDAPNFNILCKSRTKICVVDFEKEPTPKFIAIHKKFQKSKFLFLNCLSSDIFGDMKKGLYIFHPKKDMYIFSEDYDQLSENLERVADGSASWVKMNKVPSEL